MPEPPEIAPSDDAATWRRRAADLLEFRPREAAVLGVLCLAVVAGAAFAYARSLPRAAPRSHARPIAGPSAEASGSPSGKLFVHMAGAVQTPGVYELPTGSRVIDGVNAAGGATPEAELSTVNLARTLADGERVYIPRRGEVVQPEAGAAGPGAAAGGATSGKVNLNTATASQLQELPGIGEVLANRIVDYRTQHGPFRSVRDLLKVEGIGEKKFDSLKDLVTV